MAAAAVHELATPLATISLVGKELQKQLINNKSTKDDINLLINQASRCSSILKDIAEGINVIAESYDGLPEAVIMDKKIHPFMIAVQFHPERLGSENEIHKNMRRNFFDAIFE